MPTSLTLSLVPSQGMTPVRKHAEVVLELRARPGVWLSVSFRVDTGASLSSMSVHRAGPLSSANPTGLDLDTTLTPRTMNKTLADGTTRAIEMFLGPVVVRFPSLPRFVFHWEFLFDPTLQPDRALLGIGGRVLNDVGICFDGPSREYPSGSVTFTVLTLPLPLFPRPAAPTSP